MGQGNYPVAPLWLKKLVMIYGFVSEYIVSHSIKSYTKVYAPITKVLLA